MHWFGGDGKGTRMERRLAGLNELCRMEQLEKQSVLDYQCHIFLMIGSFGSSIWRERFPARVPYVFPWQEVLRDSNSASRPVLLGMVGTFQTVLRLYVEICKVSLARRKGFTMSSYLAEEVGDTCLL